MLPEKMYFYVQALASTHKKMAKSKNTTTTTNFKNPLAQAFGMVLRRQRDISGKTSDEIAEAIGIGASYYRLVESGTNNLHISKVVKLVTAFEGVLKFEAVSKVLLSVSLMEVTANKLIQDAEDKGKPRGEAYAQGLMAGAKELEAYDDKLRLLFSKFHEIGLFEKVATLVPEKIEEDMKGSNIIRTLEDFLIRYKDFGKPMAVKHTEFVSNFLDDVPTFYLDYLISHKALLLQLPLRVNFSDLWQWEDRHQNSFIKMVAIAANPTEIILSIENLRKYKYRHLWGRQYEEALIICNTDSMSSEEIKNEFTKNLKQSLEESKDYELLKTFYAQMEKVKFKSYDFNKSSNEKINSNIKKILSSVQFDKTQGKYSSFVLEDTMPGAVWIHTLKDYSVGFFAMSDKKNKTLLEGVGLTLNEVSNKIEIFKSIWEEI